MLGVDARLLQIQSSSGEEADFRPTNHVLFHVQTSCPGQLSQCSHSVAPLHWNSRVESRVVSSPTRKLSELDDRIPAAPAER